MQERQYQSWLEAQGYGAKVIQSRISNARTVERHYENMDTYDRSKFEHLKELFRYSMRDEIDGRANPTTIPIDGNIRNGLATYKGAVALYRRFREETANDLPQTLPDVVGSQPAPVLQAKKLISLERDMQVLLRRDIGQLEAGLTIIDDGAEREVTSGRIDITAKDKDGAIVVIELKIGKAGREAVGQILGYISDIIEEEGNTPVRGILVADGFDQSALSVSRLMPLLSLRKYSINFQFSNAND
ncbi:MAG: DUF91 domain-containing protein [Alphaproteobacteria bacterium]|nr:DUF91 domain-containing protein [Alphaproteobacteria bacterium]